LILLLTLILSQGTVSFAETARLRNTLALGNNPLESGRRAVISAPTDNSATDLFEPEKEDKNIDQYSPNSLPVSGPVLPPTPKAIPSALMPPVSITLEPQGGVMIVGRKLKLKPTVYPVSADQNLIWRTSDWRVATVSRGVVRGKRPGSVTIIAVSKADPTVKARARILVMSAPWGWENPDTLPLLSARGDISNAGCNTGFTVAGALILLLLTVALRRKK
jgi:hypothetical protein